MEVEESCVCIFWIYRPILLFIHDVWDCAELAIHGIPYFHTYTTLLGPLLSIPVDRAWLIMGGPSCLLHYSTKHTLDILLYTWKRTHMVFHNLISVKLYLVIYLYCLLLVLFDISTDSCGPFYTGITYLFLSALLLFCSVVYIRLMGLMPAEYSGTLFYIILYFSYSLKVLFEGLILPYSILTPKVWVILSYYGLRADISILT
jgi:hypothetical protein